MSNPRALGIDNQANRRLQMRQLLLCLSVLLLGLSWAAAQDTSSQSSPNSTSTGQASSSGQTSSTAAGGETTVEGCLSGSNGNFTLSDKNGTTYSLTGDTAKLSEHVGHEVKITGSSSSGAASSSSTGTPSATGSASSQQSLQVSSVKHVSKTCQAGGATAK
jgi:hypothetical protein